MKKGDTNACFTEVNAIVSQCDRCGSCLTVCPLFGEKDVESSSARGKNNLARALVHGVVQPSDEVLGMVNFCLLCRSCVDNCPNKVKTDDAMIALRQYFADKNGGPGAKYKALGTLMKNRTLVKLSAGTCNVLRKIGANALLPNGVVPSEFTRCQYLASFAGPAALGSTAPLPKQNVTQESKVAYFTGCGMQMLFPDAVAASLAALRTLTTPQVVDNHCCGLPHLAHGQRAEFLELAKQNIALFEDADRIVSDCASCSGTLKHIAAYFADDPVWRERAAAFSAKVMGLSEYLVQAGYTPRKGGDAGITFHEPCHLGRGQGIKKQPRELLQATGRFVEMKGSDRCCGGAGSFHLDYPEIAAKVLGKKRSNIEQSGADIVVSECPTCLVQLQKASARSNGKFKVMHISQVI